MSMVTWSARSATCTFTATIQQIGESFTWSVSSHTELSNARVHVAATGITPTMHMAVSVAWHTIDALLED